MVSLTNNLYNKSTMRVLGLMSGTSMDGLDCLLCDIYLDELYNLEYDIIDFQTISYSSKIRELINNCLDGNEYEISIADDTLGKLFSEISCKFLDGRKIDIVGSHGQTIAHTDGVSSTQIGNPRYISQLLNVPVVYDFRTADINVGGNGAPLVPFLDWLLYKNTLKDTITLNIGGIANLTKIPKSGRREDVYGFDTGPGMALIDECAKLFWNMNLDENGCLSSIGAVIKDLLEKLLNHPFIKKIPPKSTGRDVFGRELVKQVVSDYPEQSPEDIIRTMVEFTAKSISVNIQNFLNFCPLNSQLIVNGGGVYHQILMQRLNKLLNLEVVEGFNTDVNPDSKEALLMAVLAVAKFKNIPANMPVVTGANELAELGYVLE